MRARVEKGAKIAPCLAFFLCGGRWLGRLTAAEGPAEGEKKALGDGLRGGLEEKGKPRRPAERHEGGPRRERKHEGKGKPRRRPREARKRPEGEERGHRREKGRPCVPGAAKALREARRRDSRRERGSPPKGKKGKEAPRRGAKAPSGTGLERALLRGEKSGFLG